MREGVADKSLARESLGSPRANGKIQVQRLLRGRDHQVVRVDHHHHQSAAAAAARLLAVDVLCRKRKSSEQVRHNPKQCQVEERQLHIDNPTDC